MLKTTYQKKEILLLTAEETIAHISPNRAVSAIISPSQTDANSIISPAPNPTPNPIPMDPIPNPNRIPNRNTNLNVSLTLS